MRASATKLWLAMGAVALVTAGCSCGDTTCDDLFVTFDSPKDAETVPATTDVSISVADKNGTALELDKATICTRLASATECSVPRDSTTNTGGKATFTGVTLESGQNFVKVTVQKKGTACTGTKSITVDVVDNVLPTVLAIAFPQDLNADKVLNSAELPTALPLKIDVTTQGAVGGTLDIINQATGLSVGAPFPVAITVTGLMQVQIPTTFPLPDGTYSFFAKVTKGALSNSASTTSVGTILLDRTSPTCSVTTAKAVVGPNDDADTTANLYQVRATATANGAQTIELKLSSPATSGVKPFTGGNFTYDFTVPTTGTTTYTFTVVATDTNGNDCTATTTVTADFDPPTIVITSPTAAGSPYSSFNIPITATTSGGAVSVHFKTTPSGGVKRDVGPVLSVVANNASGTGSFPSGLQLVSATATDAVGNESDPVSETITVAAIGCPLAFSRPAANPVTLTQADNATPGAATLSYALEATTSVACAGKTVSIRAVNNAIVAPQSQSGTTNGSGVYRSPTFVIPETTPNSVDFEAQIDDGTGVITKTTVTIIVNLQSPVLTFPSANFKITALRDRARGTAGGQYDLLYQPTPPAGATATVCTDTQVVSVPTACPDGTGFVLATNVPPSNSTFNYPEGSYQVKVVFLFLGGGMASTAFVPIVVDTVRPTVTGVAFQGDANSDGMLNLTEQASGDPVAVITTAGVENGQPIVVRLSAGGVVSPATAVTVTNNAATVPLPGLAAGATTEADFSLVVVAQDAIGNNNITANPTADDPLNTPALITLRVDRVRPTCSFVLPNKASLGIADDADGTAAGYQVTGSVSVPTDVQAAGVTLTLSGGASPDVKTPTPSGGIATQNFTVAGTGETTYTLKCQAQDRAGNTNATPDPSVQVLVDLVAPGCTLTAPVAGGGTGSGGEYVTFQIPTTVSVTNGDALTAKVFSKIGSNPETQLDQIVVAAGTAQKTIIYPNGTQTVRASVTDGAGNSCSSSQTIVVNAPGCSISFTAPASNPAFLNKSNDTAPASPATLEYTLLGTTDCLSQQIRFYSGVGAGKAELAGSPATTSGTGGFSFPISLPEGAVTLTAEMNNGSPSARSVDVTVDLTDPVVTGVSPTGATLTFVAPGNYFLRAPANPAYVVDTDIATAGAQFVVNLNAAGAAGGQASVLYQGVTVAGPVNIITASEPVSLPVTLTHNTTGTLVIRVTDVAGNSVDQTSAATVDVIAPAAPAVTALLFAGKERNAIVTLGWGPVYDDGTDTASGGLVAGPNGGYYDVRWTTSVVSSGLTSADDFFNSALAYADATSAWSASTISRDVLTPPLVTTRFYVRARDEVGNYSPFVAAGGAQTVNNPWNTYTLNAPASVIAGQGFGFRAVAHGSLNNDGIDDLVVTANVGNRVFIYYGGPNFATAAPQEITPPPGVILPGNFGDDCSIGNAADDGTGSTKMDLLVGSPLANSNAGRAVLYFGRNQAQLGTTAADFVVFAGNASSQLGRSAQIVPDVNGDGIDDIFLAGQNEDASRGHVYLFYGRTEADWKLLPQPIPTSSADRHFLGPNPPPSGGTQFGRIKGGFANMGRVGAADAGPSDFTIPASLESVNRVFLFNGASVWAAAPGTVFTTGNTDAGTADDSMQTFAKPPVASGSSFGYGTRVIGGLNATGGTALDMIISYAIASRVMIHTDRTAALFPSESTVITGPANALFGHDVLATDLTADSATDLVIGERVASASNLWVFMNTRLAGAEFDTAAAPGTGAGFGFWHATLNTTAGPGRLGVSLASGNFNGNVDGKQDLVAGDDLDGNGKVTVWYPP